MCPAIPSRLKATPYKPQRELKHKRTHAVLRVYARKRAAFAAMKLLVLCIFIAHYLPDIRAWRKEQRRIAARHGNKRRQRKHRKLQRLLARIAKLETKRTQLRAEIAQYEERIRLKEWHARKHATEAAGFRDGWTAATPTSEAELKALSYARRYISGYMRAVAEKTRVTALMAAQQAKVIAQPKPIAL